jgi:hypothetical protein
MPAVVQKHRINLLPSAVRTATTVGTPPGPPTPVGATAAQPALFRQHLGAIAYLNVSAASGTGGLKVFLRCYDTLGNAYAMNGGGTAVTAIGKYAYVVYPGGGTAPVGSNVADANNLPLGQQVDVQVTHADGSNYTYSLDIEFVN